jgi:hypothetical protein
MDPVAVKGKPEPVSVWRAVSARSRFGVDVDIAPKTPFIGRDYDLGLLKMTYQRVMRESSIQLVTVVGEPGVGKSRLISELFSFIDEQDELVYWRQGRSLPTARASRSGRWARSSRPRPASSSQTAPRLPQTSFG